MNNFTNETGACGVSKKRLLTVFLVVVMCWSVFLPASANSDIDVEEKADVLNRLSILTGVDGNYNLGSQIKRNEAVVFITRILGQADYIIENKDSYTSTGFSDVKDTAWYAPYVGYCVRQNIIGGYEDGTFKPENYISEKAFLCTVLRALGYVYDKDFTWNTVYQKAYKAGIVNDVQYLDKSADNTQYTRGDVVNILYNCLKCCKKDSNITLIQNLINDGVITKELALSTGIINDEIVTAIEKVTALAPDRIQIEFNEKIQEITSADITIYQTDDFTQKLTGYIYSISDNIAVIETSSQTPETDYTVEITRVMDTDGNQTNFLSAVFKGYKNPVISSDFFKVSKVEPVSKRQINVYFTQPVNINSELPFLYEIMQGENSFVKGSFQTITVKCMGGVNNGVTILLKDRSLMEETNYTLKVSGNCTSVYGVKLNEGLDDNYCFTATSGQEAELSVVGVRVLDDKTMQVEFSKYVDEFYAQKFLNYSITCPDGTPVAVVKAQMADIAGKTGKVVNIGIMGTFNKSWQYTLSINFLPDIFKETMITEGTFKFSGNYADQSDLRITGYEVEDCATVKVYFDKPLDSSTAENCSYYSIIGTTHSAYFAVPTKVIYGVSGGRYYAKLLLPDDKILSGSKQYKVRVSRLMKYNLGNTSKQDSEYAFTGSSKVYERPSISQAVIISKDTILVRFNREIAAEIPNILPSNYILEYKDEGITVRMIPCLVGYIDNTTLVMKVDSLDFTRSYRLKFSEIKDLGGKISAPSDGQNYTDVIVGKQ